MIKINSFYDLDTSTFTHLVKDTVSKQCVVIDPVLGFDIYTAHLSEQPLAAITSQIKSEHLQLLWILETHAHADHLTAAQQLKKSCGGQIATGQGITTVQKTFKSVYQLDADFSTEGEQFDCLLSDKQCLNIGNYKLEAIATPGHTPDSVSYKIEDNIFIGDTLFHPETGSARCDFPGGDAAQLFASIEKLLAYDDATNLFLCHDYPSADRKAIASVTVAEMKSNVHLQQCNQSVAEFISLRNKRDSQLGLPKLIIPSVQVNICAGIEPEQADAAILLKWPVNGF